MPIDHTAQAAREQWFLAQVEGGVLGIMPEGRVVRLVNLRWGRKVARPLPIDTINGEGYRQVRIVSGGSPRFIRAHRLVYLARRGPIPPGHEINHINGDKADNRPENLEAVSKSANQRHAYRLGLIRPRMGEAAPRSRISDADALAIRQAYAAGGTSQATLAARYGVSQAAISFLVRGQSRAAQAGPTSTENRPRRRPA